MTEHVRICDQPAEVLARYISDGEIVSPKLYARSLAEALAADGYAIVERSALDRLLDESAVRERLGVGHSTYYQLISDGALSSVKLGRRRFVKETDLNNFIAGLGRP